MINFFICATKPKTSISLFVDIVIIEKLDFFLNAAVAANNELDAHSSPISLDASQFHGSMHQGKDESDTNCWTSPSGHGFMIRGRTYLKDYSKVSCCKQYLHSFSLLMLFLWTSVPLGLMF